MYLLRLEWAYRGDRRGGGPVSAVTDRLLASRILNAAQAVLGPLTRPDRFVLLCDHEEFDHLPLSQVLDLASAR